MGRALVCGTIGKGFEGLYVEEIGSAAMLYVEEIGSAAMLTVKKLAGVTPEVKLRESATTASEASRSVLKSRGDVTRSPEQRYQWSHKNNLSSPKILK